MLFSDTDSHYYLTQLASLHSHLEHMAAQDVEQFESVQNPEYAEYLRLNGEEEQVDLELDEEDLASAELLLSAKLACEFLQAVIGEEDPAFISALASRLRTQLDRWQQRR